MTQAAAAARALSVGRPAAHPVSVPFDTVLPLGRQWVRS
ncbi:hypothetical protein BJY24_000834 [Nocardia transvalensis]|uniref:Uncharacterized protein n=1 Tax=Nocardia transvalensis TaxID=37333 RepID=A0A7W9P9L1_9NOCA|nr:hypothetical protein [Nocardia transvalensis]